MSDVIRASECEICGVAIEQPRIGRPRTKCSKACRTKAYENKRKSSLRAAEPNRIFAGSICSCQHCSASFQAVRHDQKFCSANCRQKAQWDRLARSGVNRSAVWFGDCADCGQLIAVRHSSVVGVKICRKCRVARNRTINSRKNHERRSAGVLTVSVDDLARRDGSRCNLCNKQIDMSLPGSHKFGPTIDHLLPVSMGGTNDAANLALAHRTCNTIRGNRGAVQMLMEVIDAGSTAETG